MQIGVDQLLLIVLADGVLIVSRPRFCINPGVNRRLLLLRTIRWVLLALRPKA